MKIILSRKGFDTGCGGSPSPYFAEDGFLFSLPIPTSSNTFYSYKDLFITDTLSCYELMEQLGIRSKVCNAHTDPDIRKNIFDPDKTDKNWHPMFGQYSQPQAHLNRQKIGDGDLFLFYGLFQDVQKDSVGSYYFIPNTKKQIIWGYMQIAGNPHYVVDNQQGYLHPHYYCYSDYLKYANTNKRNTVYYGRDFLNNTSIPGYGTFRYDQRLVLSESQGNVANEYNLWRMPLHFFDHKMTGNSLERFTKDEDSCIVQIANRGQEFVINDERATNWALDLIKAVPKE